jgi:hypothetical protein
VPVNYLREGVNELMIFDEDGGSPNRARIIT